MFMHAHLYTPVSNYVNQTISNLVFCATNSSVSLYYGTERDSDWEDARWGRNHEVGKGRREELGGQG